MTNKSGIKIITTNRKAYHEYFIEDKIEAGIELRGSEVKSIRLGNINLRESHVGISNGEIWLYGCHINPFEQANRFNHEPDRNRKLLMHKHEIFKLQGIVQQKGLTLIPTSCYFKNGKVKIEVGVARGKKHHDKRQAIAQKDAKIQIERRLKDNLRIT